MKDWTAPAKPAPRRRKKRFVATRNAVVRLPSGGRVRLVKGEKPEVNARDRDALVHSGLVKEEM